MNLKSINFSFAFLLLSYMQFQGKLSLAIGGLVFTVKSEVTAEVTLCCNFDTSAVTSAEVTKFMEKHEAREDFAGNLLPGGDGQFKMDSERVKELI